MKQTLAKQQSLRLSMTPQLRWGIRLLQMSSLDLSEELRNLQELNPLLEVFEQDDSVGAGNFELPDVALDLWERSTQKMKQESLSIRKPAGRGRGQHDHVDLEGSKSSLESVRREDSIAESPILLRESLRHQALFLFLDADQQRIADLVIENINAAGYLEASLEEIHAALGGVGSLMDVEGVLARIQTLEPSGIAARTLQECLGLQLDSLENTQPGRQVARQIVACCLPCLARKDYHAIQKRLGLSAEEIAGGIGLIRQLDPYPGYREQDDSVHHVVPDVLVYRRQGCWDVRLNLESLPRVSVNQDYQQQIEQGRGTEYKALKEQLHQAKWLVENVRKRYRTILEVAGKIVEYQQDYFDFGPGKIKSMTLRDVAVSLGIHESTVSRVVNNKYLSGSTGIRELRYFFSSRVVNVSGNADSSLAVKAEIRRIVEGEDSTLPATDNQICLHLRDKGYRIARRTVAKYRTSMRIPPVAERGVQNVRIRSARGQSCLNQA